MRRRKEWLPDWLVKEGEGLRWGFISSLTRVSFQWQ